MAINFDTASGFNDYSLRLLRESDAKLQAVRKDNVALKKEVRAAASPKRVDQRIVQMECRLARQADDSRGVEADLVKVRADNINQRTEVAAARERDIARDKSTSSIAIIEEAAYITAEHLARLPLVSNEVHESLKREHVALTHSTSYWQARSQTAETLVRKAKEEATATAAKLKETEEARSHTVSQLELMAERAQKTSDELKDAEEAVRDTTAALEDSEEAAEIAARESALVAETLVSSRDTCATLEAKAAVARTMTRCDMEAMEERLQASEDTVKKAKGLLGDAMSIVARAAAAHIAQFARQLDEDEVVPEECAFVPSRLFFDVVVPTLVRPLSAAMPTDVDGLTERVRLADAKAAYMEQHHNLLVNELAGKHEEVVALSMAATKAREETIVVKREALEEAKRMVDESDDITGRLRIADATVSSLGDSVSRLQSDLHKRISALAVELMGARQDTRTVKCEAVEEAKRMEDESDVNLARIAALETDLEAAREETNTAKLSALKATTGALAEAQRLITAHTSSLGAEFEHLQTMCSID